MPATRTCPRCKTENDFSRSNCQTCGGVMLGVAAGLGNAGVDASPAQSRGNPASNELEEAIRQRLDKAQNLSPEKKAAIEAALQKRLGQRFKNGQATQENASTQGRGRGCAVLAAAIGIFMAGSTFLFLSESRKFEEKLIALLPHKAPPVVPEVRVVPPGLPTAPTDVLGDVQPDQVQTDKFGQPLVPEPTQPRVSGETMTREQMRPFRSCFHGRGYPTERPMSFGIETSHVNGTPKATVFAMTDVQVPKPVAECIGKRVVFQHWAPGIHFVDWPADDNWP